MVFSEPSFLFIFLSVCLVLNILIKSVPAKNGVLLVMSLLFYAWGEPVYVLLMVGTSLVSWLLGMAVESFAVNQKPRRRLVLAAAVVVDLLPLIFFKYSGFIAESIGAVFDLDISFNGPELPIGISFYTFQIIAYIVDVYRGVTPAQRNPFYLMLYVSLFPQLIAGPIVRYADVAKEIDNRSVTAEGFTEGVCRFVTGLGKKVILADTIGRVFSSVLEQSGNVARDVAELNAIGAWGIMICYAFQIYFDFSGYSDMAIGLGKMLGFNYNENFNYPYISTSIKEFWRRWHISMSSFFRDYIYIPLGGNRRHQVFNMLVVWAATGLWHGAGWNFVLWGLYFFLLLMLEKYLVAKIPESIRSRRSYKAVSLPFTFALVVIGWVLFYFEDMGVGLKMLGRMFGAGNGGNIIAGPVLLSALPVISLCVICATPIPAKIKNALLRRCGPWTETVLRCVYVAVIFLICTALIIGGTYHPFMYFRY